MTPLYLRTTAALLALCTLAVGLRLPAADAPAVDAHGDPLPRHARLRLGTERFRQGGSVSALRYSSDGKTLLSAGDDQVYRWFDAGTGKEQRHFAATGTGTLAPDGKTFAAIEYDSMQNFPFIRLWDTVTNKGGHQLGAKQVNTNYTALGFSPDSKMIAAIEQDNNGVQSSSIRLWDTATGKELHRLQAPTPKEGQQPFMAIYFRFSPDNKRLVATGNEQGNIGTLHVWETTTGKLTFSPAEFVTAAEGNRRDQLILRNGGNGGPFDADVGTPLFSPDSKVLAALVNVTDKDGANQTHARLYDAASGKRIRDLNGGPNSVQMLFDPTGKTLAVLEQNAQTVHLFDVANGKDHPDAAGKNNVQAWAFSPDGKTLALGDNNSVIQLWDVAAGKELHELKGFAAGSLQVVAPDGSASVGQALVFAPDGQTLAASGGALVRRWTVATGKEIVLPNAGHEGAVQAVVVSPDGKQVISIGADDTIRFWDMAAGKETRQFKGPSATNPDVVVANGTASAALSADGKTLAVGFGGGQIILWDTVSGKELIQLKSEKRETAHEFGVCSLAFSANGKALASAGLDGRVFWWNVAKGEMIRQFAGQPFGDAADIEMQALTGAVYLALSPDGRTLALTSNDDQGNSKLQLIELATGKQRRVFKVRNDGGNAGPAVPRPGAFAAVAEIGIDSSDSNFVTFAPDGKSLAWTTGTSIRLWDLVRGREVRRFGLTEGAPYSTVFSPDGKHLSAASREGGVYLWEVATGTVLGQLTGHRGSLACVAFAPGGKTLVSAGADTTLLLWDVPGFLAAEQTLAGELAAPKLKDLWDRLAHEDSEQADEARQDLTGAPKQAVAYLRERIKPVAPPDAKRIEQLLDELEHKAFPVRKKAEDELEKLGELAEPALRKRLDDGPGLEAKTRLESLVKKLTGPVTQPDRLRALRVVEVLEQIGTPEAREVLQTVAKGAPDSRLTQEAQASLGRLKK